METHTIPLFKVHIPSETIDSLKTTLYSGYITSGPKVIEFEERLGNFLGTRQLLCVSSCTHAIELALRAMDFGPGDEIISSPLTCIATNMPMMVFGARIRWADVLPDTGNIDPASIEPLITPRTKAIIYVHWAGNPGNIDAINAVAARHSLKVIEDAAHAFGAEYKGKKVGLHSDFVVFSFQAIKHLTTGDGGLIVCKDPIDFAHMKSLRWFGLDRERFKGRDELRWTLDIPEWGYKFNMNDIDATIGLCQMPYIENILKTCRRNGTFYDRELQGIPGVQVLRQEEGAHSAYWLYTVLVDQREEFVEFMKQRGVATNIVHTRNDLYACFKDFKEDRSLPGLDVFEKRYISIPCGWWVTEEDARFIVDAMKDFFLGMAKNASFRK